MSNILEARELRAKHISDLMNQYPHKTVVILKTNVVGEDKNPVYLEFIFSFFCDMIRNTFYQKVIDLGHVKSLDGNYCYYVIDEIGRMVKIRTMEIEESTSLGRLIDIDVYHIKSISRQDVSCEMRKCLICDNYAHLCARNQTHSHEEIHEKMKEIVHNFLTNYLTNISIKAIYSELKLYPKFGLVSKRDSGCHTDMDYETFVKSTFAIKKYIREYIIEGLNIVEEPLKLQKIGLRAESRMFKATNNINTHKGLIFLLGIFLPAISETIIKNESKEYLINKIQFISQDIVGDYYKNLDQKEEKSNADYIFLEHGFKGIRGEAIDGLKLIFDIPEYTGTDYNIIHHNYLIHLMSKLDDTTIIHKTDLKTLRQVQRDMKIIVETGGYENNVKRIEELSNQYIDQNISPGGSADMLVIKIIYEEIKRLIK